MRLIERLKSFIEESEIFDAPKDEILVALNKIIADYKLHGDWNPIRTEADLPKDCYEIIRKYLIDNGYDGLFNDGFAECACLVDDLFPCGELYGKCTPGYKVPCNCGEHDYHIAKQPLPEPYKPESKE